MQCEWTSCGPSYIQLSRYSGHPEIKTGVSSSASLSARNKLHMGNLCNCDGAFCAVPRSLVEAAPLRIRGPPPGADLEHISTRPDSYRLCRELLTGKDNNRNGRTMFPPSGATTTTSPPSICSRDDGPVARCNTLNEHATPSHHPSN